MTTPNDRTQVTIPAEVRRLLRIKPRDKVAVTIEDGRVGLVSATFTRTEDLKSLVQEAKEEKAERELEKWC